MKFVHGVTAQHNGMITRKNEKKNLINNDAVHVDENSCQSMPFACDAL